MRPSISTIDWRIGSPASWGLTALGVTLVYAIVLALTFEATIAGQLLAIGANVVPLLAVAAVARWVVLRFILPLPTLPLALAHLVAALVFAVFWFWLLMVTLGMASGDGPVTFSVQPFLGPAAVWQLMQGVSFYAVVALMSYIESMRFAGPEAAAETLSPTPTAQRLFVKEGDESRPLDTTRIVHIRAAGDYAEVVTQTGNHMLRMAMTELESMLGDAFLRIHRSHIVNIDKIERMEPAGGGRMSLHLSNGESLVASRAGAKAIRDRTV